MKCNLLFAILCIFMFFSAYGQKIENFSNAKLPTSYSTGKFVGTDSIVWNYVNARGGQTTTANANAAISLNKAANACLFSDTLRYGLQSIAFQYEQELTTSCNASVWVNDSCIALLTTAGEADVTKYVRIEHLSFTGNVVITIKQNAANSGQITIDDIALVFAEKPVLPFTITTIEHNSKSTRIVFSHSLLSVHVSMEPHNQILALNTIDSVLTITYNQQLCGVYTVALSQMYDFIGRSCRDTLFTVEFEHVPQVHDIRITEIMADPSPLVALPEFEYIELFNASECDINLVYLSLAVGNELYALPHCIVKSGSYVLLVSQKAKYLYGDTVTVCSMSSFPALLNSGQTIALMQAHAVISSVTYNDSWYGSKIKKDGGWSLEKIDINNVSETQGNWCAANNFRGGTPGYSNSVSAVNIDTQNPKIIYMALLNDTTILCKTDENCNPDIVLQSLECSDDIQIYSCKSVNNNLQEFILYSNKPFHKQNVYTCVVTDNLCDFAGNCADPHQFELALYDTVCNRNEILITEFLHNPIPGRNDFVELYNNSNKFINLSHIIIANRDSVRNDVGSYCIVTQNPIVFLPHTYTVLSVDAMYYSTVSKCQSQSLFIHMPTMPSFNDAQGTIIVQNIWGMVIDSVTYSETWHSKTLRSAEGISLERLDYTKPAYLATNWQSASTLSGGMTPGCENSQFVGNESTSFSAEHTCITPNNDGDNDVLRIAYTSNGKDKTVQLYVFSFDGMLVQHTINNQLLANSGIIVWDATNAASEIVPPGVYILLIEVLEQGTRVFAKKMSCTVLY